jgi:hypothetical protein
MPKGNKKGSGFERQICKQLSLWWTRGERDDVFWRSSQSGGRATVRSRKGKTTAGSYGDIVALDPIGKPLTDLFTIELKRGKSHGHPGDLIDCKGDPKCNEWYKTMQQAQLSADNAGTPAWMIISRRDCRKSAVFFPTWVLDRGENGVLAPHVSKLVHAPAFRYITDHGDFTGVELDKFLEIVDPVTLTLKV